MLPLSHHGPYILFNSQGDTGTGPQHFHLEVTAFDLMPNLLNTRPNVTGQSWGFMSCSTVRVTLGWVNGFVICGTFGGITGFQDNQGDGEVLHMTSNSCSGTGGVTQRE